MKNILWLVILFTSLSASSQTKAEVAGTYVSQDGEDAVVLKSDGTGRMVINTEVFEIGKVDFKWSVNRDEISIAVGGKEFETLYSTRVTQRESAFGRVLEFKHMTSGMSIVLIRRK